MFLTTCAAPGMQDTSSKDEHPAGPLKAVENDPFEVMWKSMLSPSASTLLLPMAPSVCASVSDTHGNDDDDISLSKIPSSGLKLGLTPDSSPMKREYTALIAFLHCICIFFQKPKGRDMVSTKWDKDHSLSLPPSSNWTKAKE